MQLFIHSRDKDRPRLRATMRIKELTTVELSLKQCSGACSGTLYLIEKFG